MRRRLFWTIAVVAAVTGLLVLIASVYTSQRAAIDATYRELEVSANEAVSVIHDVTEGRRPTAILDVIRLFDTDDEASAGFARIRRTAGGSEIGLAVVNADGVVQSNAV